MNEVRRGLKPVPEILHRCFYVGINRNLSDIKTETTVVGGEKGAGKGSRNFVPSFTGT
jgi:hypothetical protein